jgi:hypothetical protein
MKTSIPKTTMGKFNPTDGFTAHAAYKVRSAVNAEELRKAEVELCNAYLVNIAARNLEYKFGFSKEETDGLSALLVTGEYPAALREPEKKVKSYQEQNLELLARIADSQVSYDITAAGLPGLPASGLPPGDPPDDDHPAESENDRNWRLARTPSRTPEQQEDDERAARKANDAFFNAEAARWQEKKARR